MTSIASLVFKERSALRVVGQVLGAVLLLGLSSWVTIPLPFSPVPIAITPQLILFFAVILRGRGALAALLYGAFGFFGLPFFAGGGSGLAHLAGPTGGYIIGYCIAAASLSFLSKRGLAKGAISLFGILLVGNLIIYLCGLCQLSFFVPKEGLLRLGVYPFITADLLKLLFVYQGIRAFKIGS